MEKSIENIDVKPGRQIIEIFIKILFLILVGYFLVTSLNVKSITAAFENANLILLAAGLILGVLNLYFQYLKWKVSAEFYLSDITKSQILNSLFSGLAAGVLTPFRLGEYAARKISIPEQSVFWVTTATAIDKLSYLIILILLSGIGALYFAAMIGEITYTFASSITAIAVLTFLIALFSKHILKNVIKKLLSFVLKKFKSNIDSIKVPSKLVFKLFAISCILFFIISIQFTILFLAFAVHASFTKVFLLSCTVFFSKTVLSPLSLIDFGLRESAAVYFAVMIGISAASAFNGALMLFTFNVLIPIVIGSIIIMRKSSK